MFCRKCNSDKSAVQLRKKDLYCVKCFITNINHKFRASIGKNRLFSNEQHVLVCLSGGEGSTVMLDLINNGLALDNHKRLRIKPFFLHLHYGNNDIAEGIIEQCRKYDFFVYIVNLTDYLLPIPFLPEVNTLPKYCADTENCLDLLINAPPTAHNFFLNKIKRSMYIKYAKLLECNFIFTAETTSTLATNLLSSIALGRGSHVEGDIGFIDNRDGTIQIVRPMKDISKEELYYYIKNKDLKTQNHNELQKHSLQVLLNNFVNDLQDNFPSTISTVCKTADKLGVVPDDVENKTYDRCKICQSCLSDTNGTLTALQATDFSRIVSNISTQDTNNINFVQENQSSMFPHLNKHLCYSCSRNYSELNVCALTQNIDKLLTLS